MSDQTGKIKHKKTLILIIAIFIISFLCCGFFLLVIINVSSDESEIMETLPAIASETRTPSGTAIPSKTSTITSSPTLNEIQLLSATATFSPTCTSTITLSPTFTKTPTITISPSITLTVPTNTPTHDPDMGYIPGLSPYDVTLNMEKRFGCDCGNAERGGGYYSWYCKKEAADSMIIVTVYSRDMSTVDFIDAGVIQFTNPSEEVAITILGFVATMPYDNSTPSEAKKWVAETLPKLQGKGDVREKYFSNVNYQIFGIPTFYSLQIGEFAE